MADYDPNEDPDGLLWSDQTARGYISGIDGLDDFKLKEVEFAVVGEDAVYEGCIILGKAQDLIDAATKVEEVGGQEQAEKLETFGNVIAKKRHLWPKGIVPYRIDDALPEQSRVTGAIAHWEAKTDIRFVARSTEADFITFRPANGCSSHVGRQRGQQFVNLASRCTKGNTIHEIGHALGLWHEQSRADRDGFVEIRHENIMPAALHNFNQTIHTGIPHGDYDYGSIMHYHKLAFSKNGQPTIVTKQTARIGQRSALSRGDIATIQAAYAHEFAKR